MKQMTKNLWWIIPVSLVVFLFGAILYTQDWSTVKPWMSTPLRDITVSDAIVLFIIYMVLRK